MLDEVNFYILFQLPNFSTIQDIKVKYKELIKINHPDKGGDAFKFDVIKKTYEFFIIPEQKKEYDNKLKCKKN
jgi:curved DNA-binding protein CbpA